MPYIGNTIRAADDYRLIDDISSSFNGSTTSFALQVAGSAPVPFPKSPQQVLISVNGVIQEPDPTGASGFNLVGTNIVFSSAPTNGHAFFGIIYATADYLNSGGNFPSGALGAPSITFIGDEDSGLYRKGAGSVGFVSDATEIANFDSNGITISSGNIIIPDSIIHNGDPNTKIRFPAADTITVETSGSERLRINSSGHILIGTDTSMTTRTGTSSFNPSLQISSDSEAASAITRFSNTTDPGRFSIQKGRGTIASKAIVQDDDNLGQIMFSGWDGDTFTNGASIEAEVDGTPGDDDMPGRLVFATTADGAATPTERMRITSAGKVGINTTSPSERLTVIGNGVFGDGTTKHNTITINGGHVADGDNDYGLTINAFEPAITLLDRSTGAGSGQIRVQSNGGFDFLGDTTHDGTIGHTSNTTDFKMLSFEPTVHKFFISGSEKMRIDSSGRLGIGTTSPSKTLDVSGNTILNGSGTNALEIKGTGLHELYSYHDSGGVGWATGTGGSYGELLYLDESNTAIELYTSGTKRFIVDSSGNVGIGAINPDVKLDVARLGLSWTGQDPVAGTVAHFHNGNNGSSSSAYLGIGAGTASFSGINFGDADDADIGKIIYGHSDNSLSFTVNASERMRIASDGNVGIGISSPASTLHLDASGGAVLRLQRTSSNATNKLEISHDGTDGSIESTNDIDFRSGGSVRMTLDSSGRLGIGTNSPDNLLHVSAGSSVAEIESTTSGNSARLIIKSPNDTYGGLHFGDPEDSDRGRIRYYHNTDSMLFYTSADTHMTIHANGNITADDNADVLLGNATDRNLSSSDDNDPLHFESERLKTGGMTVSNTKSRITVPTTGKYMAYAMMSGSSTSNNQTDGIQLKLLKNGSTLYSVQDFPIISFGENGEEYSIQFSIMADIAANDYLEVCFDNIDAGTASLSRGHFGVYLVH